MIYLNNAATTWPKPPAVTKALTDAWLAPPEGQGRGVVSAYSTMTACRKSLGRLLGIADTERIFFASSATDALNKLLPGIVAGVGADRRARLKSAPTCVHPPVTVVSQTEHNSVLRPVYNNPLLSSNVSVVPCDRQGYVTPEAVEHVLQQFSQSTQSALRIFVLNHCSNVTGAVQDAKAIGEIAHRHGFLFVLDVSQSAGCVPIDADGWEVDALTFTGHKALFGPQGTGGFYVRCSVPFHPVVFGGTGRDSSIIRYDGNYEYEVGTQNVVGIAGLNAGVEYVLRLGTDYIMNTERAMIERIYDDLSQWPEVTLYGPSPGDGRPRSGVLSFAVAGMSPSDVAYILYSTNGIVLRSGLHCCPLIHEAMGTDKHGTIRLSVSALTTADDIQAFLDAMHQLLSALR